MENIKFEISEEDIKRYLEKNKVKYKYKEALFIKYLKENRFNLTKEMLEMLLMKNGIIDSKMIDIDYYNSFNTKSFKYDLNLTDICHILIPTMKYYDQKEFHINKLYVNLDIASDRLLVPMTNPMDVIESTLDNYRICDKVELDDEIIKVKMGKEHCRNELLVYQEFYDEDKVKKIKKLVKNRERM